MRQVLQCRLHNIKWELLNSDENKDDLYVGCPACTAMQLAEMRKTLIKTVQQRDALAAAITVKLEIEATTI